MPTVAATCAYVPPEWIAAHRLRPRRVMPTAQRRGELVHATAGLCPYARAFMNSLAVAPRPDAAVFTTVCDQMRRGAEVFAGLSDMPVFLMNVPATWETPSSLDLYADELKRLGRFLVALGGAAPRGDELARVMRDYDAARKRLRTGRATCNPRHYAEAWARLDASTALPPDSAHDAPNADTVSLALVGGPMLREQFEVFDQVARSGGRVVLTAVEGGELTAPGPFNADRLRQDALKELARAYHQTIPHPMRRPDTQLHQWLEREITRAAPRGILFQRNLWCDLWHAEVERIRQRAALPVLDMNVGDDDDSYCLAGRIQAFIETLQ